MKIVKYSASILLLIMLLIFIASCFQEKLLFLPEKLPADYQFKFTREFEEVRIPVEHNISLSGLLFKANESKGLIFYLHGNGGSNRSWGEIAELYLSNHYDFFIPDYRGYGKSEGKIKSEKQFLRDLCIIYDTLRKSYPEKNTVIIGYSIGTGPAAYLASKYHPRQLILKAPYYNIPDLAKNYVPILPAWLIRYKFRTDQYIQQVKCPIAIFHGDADEIIYTGSSYKLKPLLKPTDRMYILKGQRHNGMNNNPEYRILLSRILNP